MRVVGRPAPLTLYPLSVNGGAAPPVAANVSAPPLAPVMDAAHDTGWPGYGPSVEFIWTDAPQDQSWNSVGGLFAPS